MAMQDGINRPGWCISLIHQLVWNGSKSTSGYFGWHVKFAKEDEKGFIKRRLQPSLFYWP